ncbi:hypothetical protein BGZ98_010361 [Dissophora globulifera]|nr:hypothetical protein BGZ98_010361 [Dissophora globulifera]
MYPSSRSLVRVAASRSTTLASSVARRAVAPATATASLHTARTALAEEKRSGFLSRLNPFAKPAPESAPATTTAAGVAKDLSVEIEEAEQVQAIPSWKSERQELTAEELEAAIRSAAAPFVDTTVHLNRIHLSDPKTKFEACVLKACVVSTGQEIPNKDLASIHTLRDVLTTLQQLNQVAKTQFDNPKGHVVAEWFEKNKSALPPNMVFIPYQKSKGVKAEDRKTTNKRFL